MHRRVSRKKRGRERLTRAARFGPRVAQVTCDCGATPLTGDAVSATPRRARQTIFFLRELTVTGRGTDCAKESEKRQNRSL